MIKTGKIFWDQAVKSIREQKRNFFRALRILRKKPLYRYISDSIVIKKYPSETEIFAAEELKKYIEAVSDIFLDIVRQDDDSVGFIIKKRRDIDERFRLSGIELEKEGFIIADMGHPVVLTGDCDRALLYAVYSFCEKELGIRFFFPGQDYIPSEKKLNIKIFNRIEIPSFEIRNHRVTDGPGAAKHHLQTFDWAVKNRMNVDHKPSKISLEWKKRGDVYFDWLVHAWKDILPTDEYFESHPEYYALVNGIRGGADLEHPNWKKVVKICTTHPDVIGIIANKAIEHFDEHPTRKMFTITQSDGMQNWFCQCEDHSPSCPSLDSGRTIEAWGRTNKVMTNRIVTFSNEVVKKLNEIYPQKGVVMTAYAVTLPPPTIDVDRNVYVSYTHGGLRTVNINREMLAETEENKKFWEYLEGWREKTKNIFIYEYYPGGGWWSIPVVCNWKFSEDVKAMKAKNIKGYTWQTSIWSIYAPGIYIQSKLLWDHSLDPVKLLNEYCEKFFGPAGEYMKDVYKTLEDAFMSFQPLTEDHYVYEYLTEGLLQKLRDLFELAKDSVGSETDYHKRVLFNEISLNYTEMLFCGLRIEAFYWQNKTKDDLNSAIDALQLAYDYSVDQWALAKKNYMQNPIGPSRHLKARIEGLKRRLKYHE